ERSVRVDPSGAVLQRKTSSRLYTTRERHGASDRGLTHGIHNDTADRARTMDRAEVQLLSGRRLHWRVGAPRHRASGLSPVWRAMRASIRGPISSPSWNANTKSGQPSRRSVRWLPDSRFTDQPIRSSAAKTRRAFAAPHVVMPAERRD